MVQEHDRVALTQNRPEHDLHAGDVGAVPMHRDCYPDAAALEVEFVNKHGRTKCVATIPTDQVMKLNLLSLSA